jgi:16S rRNA (cytosine967-C5)-methyltransferase
LVRELALRALFRVNEQGAYSNVLIDAELGRGRLPPADRGLFLRLVRGSLERRGSLDWALSHYTKRGLTALDPWPREVLRLGAYQLLFLDVPAHAACDTSVRLARRFAHAGAAALVNAVLRRLAAEKDRLLWPDRFSDPLGFLATGQSHPRWLVERWLERFGAAEAEALCRANNTPPGLTVRANLLRTTRAELIEDLASEGLRAKACRLAPEAVAIEEGADVRRLQAYRRGLFTVQDEASMLAAAALEPKPGERIVDACAAPGGKTSHLAELAGDRARVLAVDVNPARLSQVKARAAMLGLRSITTLEGDARGLGATLAASADGLLVDAPCSGLGVIRRRPEVRWRRRAEDLAEMAARQVELLRGAAPCVRPGGRLVYSVCSFEPEETEGVLVEFLASQVGRDWAIAGEPAVLLPHRDGTDGFFYARLRRQGP